MEALLEAGREDVAKAIIHVCSEHFDPERLNPKAIVGTEISDSAMRLIGYSDAAAAWEVESVEGAKLLARRVFCPYAARRLARYFYQGTLTQFPWETSAVAADILEPLLSEVVVRLTAQAAERQSSAEVQLP